MRKRTMKSGPKIAVVIKRTTYRKFIVEKHDPIITRLLRSRDPTVARLKASHEAHEQTVIEVDKALAALGAEVIFRGGARACIPAGVDLVVTVGGDGTLLSASHQIGDSVPLLGINSAPESSVGFFCGAKKGNVQAELELALAGKLPETRLSRMRVEHNGELLHGRVLNEALFCHVSPAATSRYILRIERDSGRYEEEDQRSSGLWVGPAAGSTAAQRSAGGNVLALTSKQIQYVVREPYMLAGAHVKLRAGLIGTGSQIVIHSRMRDAKVFIDGHRFAHTITIGDVLSMRRSDERLIVLGIATKQRT
jgi:NAD+ kinase